MGCLCCMAAATVALAARGGWSRRTWGGEAIGIVVVALRSGGNEEFE